MLTAMVEIVVILVLVLLNGFFSLAELSVISSSKPRLRQLAARGNRRARLALALAETPAAFLSSVQIGITLVGIFAGAYGGARLADLISGALADVSLLAPYRETISLGLVVLVVTYLTLILGELVPKQMALNNPEGMALWVAAPMRAIAWLASPLISFISRSTSAVLKLLGITRSTRPVVTDEDIRTLFAEGLRAGIFEKTEEEIVDRLLRLGDRRVSSIMTPRPDVVWFDLTASDEEVIAAVCAHPFTAFPVYEDDIDNVVGVVLSRDIVRRVLAKQPIALREMLQKPLVLHEGARAIKVIDQLRRQHTPIAIIINEYGEMEGVVTMTDVVRSLVGEMPSLGESDIVQRADGSYSVDGLLPIIELKAALDLTELPGEEEGYQTLAGFILSYLGRIPQVGDAVEWAGYRFEVVDMDGRRIDRVLVTRLPQ